jgi:hypothetical protein
MSTPDELMITRTGKLYNCVTKTYPVFVHGNAKADMDWITKPEACYFIKAC